MKKTSSFGTNCVRFGTNYYVHFSSKTKTFVVNNLALKN
jgi:hypothetical protein